MTTDLSALRERVEEAKGADREIDALVWAHLFAERVEWEGNNLLCWTPELGRHVIGVIDPGRVRRNFSFLWPAGERVPAYTADLNAALGLVEATYGKRVRQLSWSICTHDIEPCPGLFLASVGDNQWKERDGGGWSGMSATSALCHTPALALLSALLSALETQ